MKDGIVRFNNITSKLGVCFTVHSQGVYELIVNEINEVIMIGKKMYDPYYDFTWNILSLSNMPLHLQEFPGLWPRELLYAKGYI